MPSSGHRENDALTQDEIRLLEAVANRIFPPTDTPGAVELGAVVYIERALADAYAEHLPAYHRGLRRLQRLARAECGGSFLALNEAQQDAVLESLELAESKGGRAKVIGRRPGSDGGFFELVRQHVLEGVFGDPQYGGNRDLAGWKLVGFGGQRHGYADPYINKPLDLDPVAEEPWGPASHGK